MAKKDSKHKKVETKPVVSKPKSPDLRSIHEGLEVSSDKLTDTKWVLEDKDGKR